MKNARGESCNERLELFRRLIKQKDAILTASQEIEDFRKQFLQANKKDVEGTIESEIQKRIYVIISALSELAAYSQNRGISQILLTTVHVATFHRVSERSQFLEDNNPSGMIGHIAMSQLLDALCASVNLVRIEWRLKKDPSVNLQGLESLLQLKFPGIGQ